MQAERVKCGLYLNVIAREWKAKATRRVLGWACSHPAVAAAVAAEVAGHSHGTHRNRRRRLNKDEPSMMTGAVRLFTYRTLFS